jgi:hypothetical protein
MPDHLDGPDKLGARIRSHVMVLNSSITSHVRSDLVIEFLNTLFCGHCRKYAVCFQVIPLIEICFHIYVLTHSQVIQSESLFKIFAKFME